MSKGVMKPEPADIKTLHHIRLALKVVYSPTKSANTTILTKNQLKSV